jgi:glycosyltransferase involved in cell wall biosynthesis
MTEDTNTAFTTQRPGSDSAGPACGEGDPRIALVINTKNEERKLAAALASCRGVDDIVVADMASTDDTVKIAKAAGGRVVDLPDFGYCEPGRQLAIDAAEADWVLLVDADERLSPGGLERLRQVVAGAPPHVSAYLLPGVTQLKGAPIVGTGWSVAVERHARLFRRDEVTWPAEIHAVPTFRGAVVDLPDGTDVVLFHECFDDLTHAYGKFNAYSAVEAAERVVRGSSSTWIDALRDGIAEIENRYQPEIDGGVSFALSMGMFFYRFGTHVKAMELTGTLRESPVPAGASMRSAWGALWTTLRDREIAGSRERIAAHIAEGRLDLAVSVLNGALSMWGVVPELLVESAVVAHAAGDDRTARNFCDQALSMEPGHAEARTTALALDVAMGRRAPVRKLVLGTILEPQTDEVAVVEPGESDGEIEAPFDDLPFAAGSLDRIRVPVERLLTYDGVRQESVVEHLLTLLSPDGHLELVQTGPEVLLARWPEAFRVVAARSPSVAAATS